MKAICYGCPPVFLSADDSCAEDDVLAVSFHFMFNIMNLRRSYGEPKVSNHNDGVTGASLFAFNDLFLRLVFGIWLVVGGWYWYLVAGWYWYLVVGFFCKERILVTMLCLSGPRRSSKAA